jgi:hypothetical protein
LSKNEDYLPDKFWIFMLSGLKERGQAKSGGLEEAVPNWEFMLAGQS